MIPSLPAEENPTGSRVNLLLAAFSALAAFHLVFLWTYYWPDGLPDGVPGSVWVSLAFDFSEGIFYRPLFSEIGFGGTRYMPLFWVLHGWLIQLTGEVFITGWLTLLISLILLHSALYFLIRLLGHSRRISLALCLAFIPTLSYQMNTLSIRGDFLATALCLWGLYAGLRIQTSRNPVWFLASVVFFLGAFLTKFTALYGAFAIMTCFWMRGKRLVPVRMAAGIVWGILFLILALYVSSQGQIWESFREVSTGGMERLDWWAFLPRFTEHIIRDPILLALVVLALAVFLRNARQHMQDWSLHYFFITLVMTLFIFSSPGTASNHLIDLHAASILVLARFWQTPLCRKGFPLILIPAGLYLMSSFIPQMPSIPKFFEIYKKPTQTTARILAQTASQFPGPIFSRYAWFDLVNGRKPYVLDRFNVDLLARKYPEYETNLEKRIRSRFFGVVIESNWPGFFDRDFNSPEDPSLAPMIARFHRHFDQDDPYHWLIRKYYRVQQVRRPFVLMVPRTDTDFLK